MKAKTYIAGPMTGYKNFNRDRFFAEAEIIEMNGGFPLNPAILPDGLEQSEYMDICLAMVRCANSIVMLKGWEKSEGAVVEHAYAKKLGISIMYQK